MIEAYEQLKPDAACSVKTSNVDVKTLSRKNSWGCVPKLLFFPCTQSTFLKLAGPQLVQVGGYTVT